MKQTYFTLLLILITSLGLQAQIPSGYYDTATGSGFTLKTQLKSIITNGHTSRSYDQLYDGAGISGSQGYVDTHTDSNVTGGTNYDNDGFVLDFYSENPSGSDPYNFTHNVDNGGNQNSEGDCYNREHLVPQSSFGSASPMQTDIHHVIPTDCRVNNFRGSFPFGNVATANWTSQNGSKRGSSAMSGYSGTVFEPIDEFKGDIARALLYFATRYENTVDGYTSFDMFNGTEDQVFFTWAIDVLLDWHNNVDPVDQRERERNDAAYAFQGNRNPFVDHPEYANMIWNPAPDNQAPTNPTNLTASNPTNNSINLTWTASTDNVGVSSYDIYIGGVNSHNTTETSFTVPGLTQNTNYCFTIKAKDAAGNESGFSNQDCEMTTDTGGPVTGELFFSEYVEGSGNNKALEIVNISSSAVDLSDYSIKRNGNGGSSWSAPLNLSGTLAAGDVFVVINGDAGNTTLINEADLIHPNNAGTNNGEPVNFNGNDPVGLFKDDVLIDIIGVFNNGTADFAKDVTLRRKNWVTSPNTTYTTNEWDSYSQDTVGDVGQHNFVLSNNDDLKLSNVKLTPNPVKHNKVFINTNQDLNIHVYDILGKLVLKTKVTPSQNSVNVSALNKGVYLFRILNGNQSVTKKLIKQ